MKSLLIYLKNYKKESVLAPLFKMLEASFELLVPLVMAAVIDVGIANKDEPYIIKMCLVLIALGVDRACVFYHGAVFFCEGSIRVWHRGAACAVPAYPELYVYGDGHDWEFHADHQADQRYQPDAVWCKPGAPAFPEVAVYCIRRYDHGVYRRYTGGADLCCGHSAPVRYRVRDHVGGLCRCTGKCSPIWTASCSQREKTWRVSV